MNEPTADTPPSPGLTPDGVSRRAALVVPAGAGLLALGACGAGAGEATGQAASSTVTVNASEVPVGGGIVTDGIAVTQPTEGEFHAFDARCPHQGCAVTRIDAEAILCPCHGSTFDPSTGERTGGPAEEGLAAKEVAVDGDTLTVS